MDTREKILQSARVVFGKKGFYATKMEDIAKEAQIGKGTLYLYFKSKEELYACLVRTGLKYIEDNLSSIINSDKPFLEKVGEIIDFVMKILEENREFILRLMYEMPLVQIWNADFREQFKEEEKNLQKLFKKFISDGIKEGTLIKGDEGFLADSLMGLITRPIFSAFLDGRGLMNLKEQLLELIKRGFCKEEGGLA